MTDKTKSKEAQDVAEEHRIFKFRPTVVPITTHMSTPVPDYAGNPIPYSSQRTGFTQMPFEVVTEIEVGVPDTGDSLYDFAEAIKKLGLEVFRANVEFSREAWALLRDEARDELLNEPL